MKYRYTWGHLKLFAQLCGHHETSSTIGENWVKILEEQQEQVFPFTLWPLTYRTSTLMASPAILTPTVSNIDTKSCKMNVKFYRSNEVVVICFIHINNNEELCNEFCLFNTMCETVSHDEHISHIQLGESLVKCGMLSMYKKLKKKVIKQLSKCRKEDSENDDVSCIICTGFGIGAAMANFMSMDLSSEFRDLQDFMDEGPQIIVDCVTFSSPNLGNTKYWLDFESFIDGHIDVQHIDGKEKKRNSLILGEEDQETVMMGRAPKKNINIKTYIEEIDKKICLTIM